MATKTSIEWTEYNWNPLSGCSRKSDGCKRCYAEKMTKRLAAMGQAKYQGLLNEQKRFNGVIKFSERDLLAPLKWKKPRKAFVNSMSDLFHENVKDEWIDQIFAVMALTPQHTYQVLTKRPERMLEYLTDPDRLSGIAFQMGKITGKTHDIDFMTHGHRITARMEGWYSKPFAVPNVWLGVSVEDQKTADERIPLLVQTPAAVRFLSAEPLLGPIDFFYYGGDHGDPISFSQLRGTDSTDPDIPGIDWLICGGESGPNARPMHPDWARSIRDQCTAAGGKFFFKQWGEWIPMDHVSKTDYAVFLSAGDESRLHIWDEDTDFASFKLGKKKAGRLLDGREWNEMPGATDRKD